MTEGMKFCKDCKWYRSPEEVRRRRGPSNFQITLQAICARVLDDERDMVTGEFLHTVNRPCRDERNDADACGPDAKHFAPSVEARGREALGDE